MCRRIIEHWAPCNHMGLLHIVSCDAAAGTPGLAFEDCASGENSFIHDPSTTTCPVCQRSRSLREHAQGTKAGEAYGATEESQGTIASLHRRMTSRTPSLRPVRSDNPAASSQDTGSTASSMSGYICGLGEHDFVDIPEGGLLCLRCGTIGAPDRSDDGGSRQSDRISRFASFADDEEGDVGSTARGSASAYGELSIQDGFTPTNLQNAAIRRAGAVLEGLSPAQNRPGVGNVGSPAPSAMSSNARAEASWALYSEILGRRLPDF